MRKLTVVMVGAAMLLAACGGDTGATIDKRWGEMSATERSNVCVVYEARGTDGVVDVILEGNPGMPAADVREWVEGKMPSAC